MLMLGEVARTTGTWPKENRGPVLFREHLNRLNRQSKPERGQGLPSPSSGYLYKKISAFVILPSRLLTLKALNSITQKKKIPFRKNAASSMCQSLGVYGVKELTLLVPESSLRREQFLLMEVAPMLWNLPREWATKINKNEGEKEWVREKGRERKRWRKRDWERGRCGEREMGKETDRPRFYKTQLKLITWEI